MNWLQEDLKEKLYQLRTNKQDLDGNEIFNVERKLVISSDKRLNYIVDFISKTSKKYAIVTYKKDGTYGFDNNFLEIHQEERTDIINGLDKFLKGHVVFPTIIHDKKIIRGLKDKDLLNNIFNITE